jgi:hypothetical protein
VAGPYDRPRQPGKGGNAYEPIMSKWQTNYRSKYQSTGNTNSLKLSLT